MLDRVTAVYNDNYITNETVLEAVETTRRWFLLPGKTTYTGLVYYYVVLRVSCFFL